MILHLTSLSGRNFRFSDQGSLCWADSLGRIHILVLGSVWEVICDLPMPKESFIVGVLESSQKICVVPCSSEVPHPEPGRQLYFSLVPFRLPFLLGPGSDYEKRTTESEVVVIGGGDEPAGRKAASMQNRQANAAGDRNTSPRRYLPEVDTEDAVKIWCSRSEPSQVTPSGPSAWRAAEQERSSSSDSEYEPEDEEDEGSSERSTEMTTSSTSTIPSGTLPQWRRIRKCYADNPYVIGEIHVYRGEHAMACREIEALLREPCDGQRTCRARQGFAAACHRRDTLLLQRFKVGEKLLKPAG
ncbi:hypothetical protein MTO96_022548 [Rhipicephalus appendiculatus]